MLPAGLTAKAIQLCAAGLGFAGPPSTSPFAIVVHTGAALARQPNNEAEAIASVRDLLALGAEFDAGPLAINGKDFATFGVTPTSVFDACALARVEEPPKPPGLAGPATVSTVIALLRQAFGARITDTIRPMNASYGVRYSWHKFGQAVDFVPAGGVGAVDRRQVHDLLTSHGVRLLELLGPGDRGHSNHWHVAFARPGQVIDQARPIEGDEDWMIDVASTGAPPSRNQADPTAIPPAMRLAGRSPPGWDVFGAAEWRTLHGAGS